MSKEYMVLMHPDGSDTYLLDKGKTFATIDEAVKEAGGYGTLDFIIVVKVDWKAEES